MKPFIIISEILFVSFLSVIAFSCQEEQVNKVEPPCITVLLGDKDGFGMGLTEGSPFHLPGGVALPLDNRGKGDPLFTDIYPADMGSYEWPVHQIIYEMEFQKPASSIKSIAFRALTLGIQDGDNQVVGSETEIKLVIDDIEVPYAFDDIDQFDYINGNWSDFAESIEIEVPPNLFYLFLDGEIEVRWVISQLHTDSESFDAFAIDFCGLEICLEDEGDSPDL